MLVGILISIITPIMWLLFIGAGLVWIVSPHDGVRLLKHAILSACVFLVSISVLQQVLARVGVLAWIVVSMAAYAIWSRRQTPQIRTPTHKASERTPVIPSSEHAE